MLEYNAGGTTSTIDGTGSSQMSTFFWLKKALITARKEQFFSPLASTTNMPKHFGKTIKVYEYVPLLDERNANDQGIDAAGATIVNTYDIRFLKADMVRTFTVEADATVAAAAINAVNAGTAAKTGAASPWTVTLSSNRITGATEAQMVAVIDEYPNADVEALAGNLYGSSKDIGTITAKLPTLTENGGRVNRVGFTRLQREGSLHKFGFFTEFTQESLDFDSDSELMSHLSRELLNGAVQLTEAVLQKDILSNAGVILYAGAAVSDATVSAEGATGVPAFLNYDNLMRLDQVLTDNRSPRQTTVITGSRLIDTKTLPAARVAFVGSELVPHLKKMQDSFGNPAFIPVQQYADAGTILNGEIGTIDHFRIIQVPEMLHWAGEGAPVTTNPGYRATGDAYDVFPFLTIGEESFTTIGFETDGKSGKFSIMTKMPGRETADRNDPYGETGFSSIKWYYGSLFKRPERIGMIKCVAPF